MRRVAIELQHEEIQRARSERDELEQRAEQMRQRLEREAGERERLEAELHQVQKMEAVGRLAAGIAHDFNNLLMGVMGSADLGLSELAAGRSPRDALEKVRRTAMAGATVVSQLMAFSHKDDGRAAPIELDALVTRTDSMLRPLLGEDIELRLRRAAPRAALFARPGQLEQVLVNLAVNARDAMPEGGRLEIQTYVEELEAAAARQLSGLRPGSYVVLQVQDTGQGMDEETMAKAFEPFFTTKGADRGTGLGLSTVHGIVTKLGGHVAVRSAVGRGTTFTIHLPRTETSGGSTALEGPTPEADPETVLVVEDDELVRMSVRHYLAQYGYRVLEAEDRAAALRVSEDHRGVIDLLLADLVLPNGVSGRQVARELVQRRPGTALVYMSAHPRHLLAERELLPSELSLLQKPFTEDTLLRTVSRALRGARASAPPPGAGGRPSGRSDAQLRHEDGATILVIEDHTVTREALQELLEDLGYDVLVAASGAEAKRVVGSRRGPLDVAIVDFRLPDESGEHVVKQLRAHHPELAVLYVSGTHPEEDAVLGAAMRQPATAFVGKPVALNELTARVNELIAAKRSG